MRGVAPNTVSKAACSCHSGEGGKASTAQLMKEANSSAPNPAQTTLRARA